MDFFNPTFASAWVIVALSIGLLVLRIIYQLYFTPLAVIPGPPIAGVTSCFEMYYDFVKETRFPWKIEELHEKYGSIVRIGPNEVHINDVGYTSTHFANWQNKYAGHQKVYGMPESTLNTIDHVLHKRRRGAISPFFSRRKITELEPMIKTKVELACKRLDEYKGSRNPLDLRVLFSCMTTDIMTEYLFPEGYNLLLNDDIGPLWRKIFTESLPNYHWFKHFPSLWLFVRGFPRSFLGYLSPVIRTIQMWEDNLKQTIHDVMDSYNSKAEQQRSHPTIFHEVLAGDLSVHDKTFDRLFQEAQSLVGAGIESTANTINTTIFYLLSNPEKLAKVKKELSVAMQDPDGNMPSSQQLEGLPYFSATITEGLRLSLGTITRFIRVSPDRDLQYAGYKLPAGTLVSMSPNMLARHKSLFDEPDVFAPERWLGKNSKADFFAFGRGQRMCLGMNLAYTELYLTLAVVLRRFDFELFETTYERDIEAVRDGFIPLPSKDSKGVRVLVY